MSHAPKTRERHPDRMVCVSKSRPEVDQERLWREEKETKKEQRQMTEPISQELFDKLTDYLKGDVNARRLVIDLLFVGHLWDDLIDQDLVRTPEEINRAFQILLVENQMNPFYRTFRDQLDPLISTTALLWMDSVKLEKTDNIMAFVLRNAFLGIIQYCGLLLGGADWVLEHGPGLWSMMNFSSKYEEFIGEK